MLARVPLALLALLDARSPATRADTLLRDAKADEALSAYDQAILQSPDDARLRFNRGCALASLGRAEEAEEAFADAWKRARDARVAGDAAYNLGRSLFERAAPIETTDRAGAIDLYARSAGAFLEAARARRGDAQAVAALELARRAQRRLEDEAREESERRAHEQRERQERIDQLDDLARRQEEAARRSEERPAGEQTDQAREQQDQLGQETQERLDSMGEGSPEAGERIREAREEQESSEQRLEARDSSGAGERQREAARLLRDAADALRREQQQQQQQQQGGQERDEREPGENEPAETDDEPERGQPQPDPTRELLEQLLDRERAERAMRHEALRRGRPAAPVDKDW